MSDNPPPRPEPSEPDKLANPWADKGIGKAIAYGIAGLLMAGGVVFIVSLIILLIVKVWKAIL